VRSAVRGRDDADTVIAEPWLEETGPLGGMARVVVARTISYSEWVAGELHHRPLVGIGFAGQLQHPTAVSAVPRFHSFARSFDAAP
jgi:hypothetical protein